ncbi:acyl-CoA dehydrogenase mitochondrial precursor [Kalaharituber pfeilii]|nr:acyl-CoA dehydrogenase mitochondrial precursor [Kalaharituber pfeilii]
MSLRILPRRLLPLTARRATSLIPSRPLRPSFVVGTPRRFFSDDLSSPTPLPIFHLSETEQMLQETVARFANDMILPKVREMDEKETMDESIIEGLFENGFMGVEVPDEYGGAGMGFGAAIVAIEELAKVDPSVSVLCDVHNTLVNTAFLKWGSSDLKKTFLPQLATESVGSFCLSEPASGSDAFAMLTTAVPSDPASSADPSHYTINGSKCWITNAGHSKIFLVFAQTNPSLPANQRHKGITCFVVPRDTPGFAISKKEKKLGIRASSTCVITFDDVRVPRENILGNVGEGYKIAMGLLNEGRVGIGAQMIGLAQGAWEAGAKYVWQERKQFGRYIGEFQGLAFQVAEARTEIEAARALVYNAMRTKEALDRLKEAGEDVTSGTGGAGAPAGGKQGEFVMQAAMAKLYASNVAQKVSGAAIEWMGGMGFVRDGLAEKFWRDSKIGAIYEGTSNIQLQTIAKLLQKAHAQ